MSLKDNGTIQKFDTGAVREGKKGKGWPTEIPTQPLRDLAVHYENGGELRGRSNWRKGFPLSSFLESAQRHLWDIVDGKEDEDHVSAIAWNVFGYKWTKLQIEKGFLSENLNDLQTYQDFGRWLESVNAKKECPDHSNSFQAFPEGLPVSCDFYYLQEGDKIEKGDEFLDPKTNEWREDKACRFLEYCAAYFNPHRRKIKK